MTTPADVTESGSPMDTPREWPRALDQVPLVLAVLGGAAGVISMIKPWQITTLDSRFTGSGQQHELTGMLSASGTLGTAYLITLIALVAVVVMTLFGAREVRPAARLIGLALTGAGLAVVGASIYQLNDAGAVAAYFGVLDEQAREGVKIKVDLGAWAGLAAVALGGLALWLAKPDRFASQPADVDDDIEEDEEPRYGEGIEVIDLTVRAG